MKIARWNVNSFNVRRPHLRHWLATRARYRRAAGNQDGGREVPARGNRRTRLSLRFLRAENLQRRGDYCERRADRCRQGCSRPRRSAAAHPRRQRRTVAHHESVRGQRPVGRQREIRVQTRLAGASAQLRAGELTRHPRMVVLGDFNIVPEDRDVHDPEAGANRSCARRRNATRWRTCFRSVCTTVSDSSKKTPDIIRGGTTGRRRSAAISACASI